MPSLLHTWHNLSQTNLTHTIWCVGANMTFSLVKSKIFDLPPMEGEYMSKCCRKTSKKKITSFNKKNYMYLYFHKFVKIVWCNASYKQTPEGHDIVAWKCKTLIQWKLVYKLSSKIRRVDIRNLCRPPLANVPKQRDLDKILGFEAPNHMAAGSTKWRRNNPAPPNPQNLRRDNNH